MAKRRKSFNERRRAAMGRGSYRVRIRTVLLSLIACVIAFLLTLLIAGMLDIPIEKLLGR